MVICYYIMYLQAVSRAILKSIRLYAYNGSDIKQNGICNITIY